MNILVLVGANVGSKTATALQYVTDYFETHYNTHNIEMIDLKDKTLNLADGRHYEDWSGDTKEVISKMLAADVIVIGFPVFQASIPAVLKNLFDLLPIDGLKGKTVSIVSTAGSNRHFLVAEMMLKPILNYMKAHVLSSYVFITPEAYEGKRLTDVNILHRLDNLADETIDIAEAHQSFSKRKNK